MALSRRDGVLAKIAKALRLVDDPTLAQASEVCEATGRSLDQVLLDFGFVTKEQRNQLVRTFNEKVRELKTPRPAEADAAPAEVGAAEPESSDAPAAGWLSDSAEQGGGHAASWLDAAPADAVAPASWLAGEDAGIVSGPEDLVPEAGYADLVPDAALPLPPAAPAPACVPTTPPPPVVSAPSPLPPVKRHDTGAKLGSARLPASGSLKPPSGSAGGLKPATSKPGLPPLKGAATSGPTLPALKGLSPPPAPAAESPALSPEPPAPAPEVDRHEVANKVDAYVLSASSEDTTTGAGAADDGDLEIPPDEPEAPPDDGPELELRPLDDGEEERDKKRKSALSAKALAGLTPGEEAAVTGVPPPPQAAADPEIVLAADAGKAKAPVDLPSDSIKLAVPGGAGSTSSKGGVLDQAELRKRTKLRLGFEGLTLGDYVIQGEIARGAFGVVLRARPEGQAKTLARERGFTGDVAMKVMLETKDPNETRRFMDEVKVLTQLQHPNIIRIFDAGVEGGLTYYTMELVNGLDTRTLVRQQGVPPLLLSVRIARDVASALALVHQRAIYHRDIKPTNIMIDRSSQPYRTVLIDFGLVVKKGVNESLIMGTPQYMPPEQAKPKGGFGEVNATSDIYSLGATFYFLLTGQPPFPGTDAKAIIQKVISEPPRDPTSVKEDVPARVAEICMKCLEKVQRDRYMSARLLEQDLEKEIKSAQLKLKAKSVWGKLFGAGGGPPK